VSSVTLIGECPSRSWTTLDGRLVREAAWRMYGAGRGSGVLSTPVQEHLTLVKHLTAERKTEEFIAGKGLVVK